MGAFTTEAIVIHRADYRDNDRMLTLLTPKGRIDAVSRGCRRPKSPLLSCSELFTMGSFELFAAREHCSVNNCMITDTFYPLREDIDRLCCASYIINICEAALTEEETSAAPFLLVARALGYLSYHPELSPKGILTAYLLHFAVSLGYRPRLNHCVICGREIDPAGGVFFDVEQGGTVCPDCKGQIRRGGYMTEKELAWLKESLQRGVKGDLDAADAPLALMQAYMESRIEKRVPPLMVKL